MNINDLSAYNVVDGEKQKLINDVLYPHIKRAFKSMKKLHVEDVKLSDKNYDVVEDYCLEEDSIEIDLSKYCPVCGRKYSKSENVCMDCLVHLKDISDKIDVRDIEFSPEFDFKGKNDFTGFEDLLSEENIAKINEFNFSSNHYSRILFNIQSQAFRNFDKAVKDNEIVFDNLDILDKVIIIVKSFVDVDFKSYGGQLGYFEDNVIYVDDRQTDALQITTLIHELSHFMIKEILTQIICKILNAKRNPFIEILSTYILSYSAFTNLIDEYSAHTVEGRFTIFGYQDYSSFKQIEQTLKDEMPQEEIEITKSIGNTFAIGIKNILESFLDRELREDIKYQFKLDILDKPNYKELAMENCQKLTDEGFMKAIWLILSEGFEVASHDIEQLNKLKTND